MTAKRTTNQSKTPGRGDSPITVGGGGRRGRKLSLSIITADWDMVQVGDQTVFSFKDALKGAKKLVLTSDDVNVTAPLKGSISLEITVR